MERMYEGQCITSIPHRDCLVVNSIPPTTSISLPNCYIAHDRLTVQRINAHLSMGDVDNLIELDIPERTFDYEGAIRITPAEHNAIVKKAIENNAKAVYKKFLDAQRPWKAFSNAPVEKRRVYRENRITQVLDSELLRTLKTLASISSKSLTGTQCSRAQTQKESSHCSPLFIQTNN
ncbi:hypothetical protein GGR51DRAFT_317657 [Nemania sp. FL0031]|nr:hypothetical protein GGR51DRAFT_317657 [Nemania sp. FL0031]